LRGTCTHYHPSRPGRSHETHDGRSAALAPSGRPGTSWRSPGRARRSGQLRRSSS
jgi:hypothetical protein